MAKSGVAFLKSHLLHGYTYVAGFVAKCNDATKFSSLQSQLRQVLRFAGRGGYLLKSRPKFVANENVAIQIATFSFATKKLILKTIYFKQYLNYAVSFNLQYNPLT